MKLAAYAVMCAIWGTTWLVIKIGLQTTPPISGVGLRFILAGAFLYAIAMTTKRGWPPRNVPWKLVMVLSATLFGANYVLTYIAETHLSSGLVAVLFGTMPFFTFGLGHFMVGERTTPAVWIGATCAFSGVAIISLGGTAQGSLLFALAAIAAALSSAFANVYAKRHSAHEPLLVLPPAMLVAGVILFVAGIVIERPDASAFSGRALGAVLYLSIAGSGIAFFLNMWL
ncbi:MAG: EamA family transporter, partial [Candidatus Eremiobacteraeota bacterium]|nr:EamA family transporter [Candidatus Eremiobacteraeota bacterium]